MRVRVARGGKITPKTFFLSTLLNLCIPASQFLLRDEGELKKDSKMKHFFTRSNEGRNFTVRRF
jgi:hypothetical protein